MTTDPAPDRYRNRAEEIEAVQWTGSNADVLRGFCGPEFDEIAPEDRAEDPDQTAAVRTHPHGGWLGLEPGDWVLKYADHFTATSDEAFRAAWETVAEPVPVGRDALRDRIAEAIREAACSGDCGKTEEQCSTERIQPLVWHHARLAVVEGTPEQIADVALAVLPPPADRAAVLREAADELDYFDDRYDPNCHCGDCYGCIWHKAAMLLRGMADEARDEQEAQAHFDQLADELPSMADEAQQQTERLPSIHANDVQGFCPACGHGVLMLGDGGHVVCTLIDCPNPDAADELLRTHLPAVAAAVAGEAPDTETPCGPAPDQCDPETGEPCDAHETERAHAEGDHERCGKECEVAMPSEKLRNAILYRAIPGSAGMLDELLRRAAGRSATPSRAVVEEPATETGGFVCKCPAELCGCGHHAKGARS